jgi:alpha-glucosidase (family GH31 glycosyl hydrolase)
MRIFAWLLAAAPVCLSFACAEETQTLSLAGGYSVRLGERPLRMGFFRPDGSLIAESAGADPAPYCLRSANASYEMSFGAFRIRESDAAPWQWADRLAVRQEKEGSIEFDVIDATGGRLARGRIESVRPGEIALVIEAQDPAHNRAAISLAAGLGEHFLGFGGQSFDVDHRGQRIPLWVEEDGIGKRPDDEYDDTWFVTGRRHSTHTPMPLYLSSRGYALMLSTWQRSIFDMAAADPETVRIEAWEGSLSLRLFDGPAPAQALERLTAHLGRPALPPAFAFAPWLDAMFGSANVRRVAQKIRERDIPCSAIWTEDWRGGTRSGDNYTLDEDWEIDRALYPDFEGLAAELHAQGYKFLTYHNTFLDSETDTYRQALSAGAPIRDRAGQPYLFTSAKFTPTSMVDLTRAEAFAWTKQKYREGIAAGADGWMADFAEWLPVDAALASGEDPAAAHNRYPVDFQRLNRELLDEAQDGVERLFFVRSAYLGSQPLVSVVWAGDQLTDWSLGDGLPSVIPMGIGLGIAGFSYFGHDIGGYTGSIAPPTSRELWFRWVELGAFSPVMRTHHGRAAFANWNWESDEASTAHFRRYAVLHARLFPYLYAMARDGAERGLPMLRPLALVYPDFEPGWTATDQYMLGDRLIVAPVIAEGATRRTISLPAGRFYPLLGGEALVLAAPGSIEVAAPIEEIPVLVPAGTLLPLLPEGVDTFVPATAGSGIVTLEEAGENRELWLWPGGRSELFEVSGLDYRWEAETFDGTVSAATWNGSPVEVENGAIEVTGTGTLRLDSRATLTLSGGSTSRRTRVVLRSPPSPDRRSPALSSLARG